MLELRPTCENCRVALPPESAYAMICSYECTFCQTCVDTVLDNVCPNCGGGFCRRPVRPASAYRDGVSRAHQRPSETVKHKPVDADAHAAFASGIAGIAPQNR